MRDFNKWLDTFCSSITTYNYYTDFDKIYKNIDSIKTELNILNSLINSKNIEVEFVNIIKEYPKTLKCIPILLAVRNHEINITDDEQSYSFSFNKMNYSIEQYVEFMRKTGLFDLLENHLISNLVDYVTGVETGLDSNGRKNRGGHLMEDLIESYIVKAGFVKEETYFKEFTIKQIEDQFNINLSDISNDGTTVKRFDFVVYSNNIVFGIETNFYSSSGSKLNETARSYKQIALESKDIQGFEFVWFTDGKGWNSAKNNLRETFDVMDRIYNINDLQNNDLNNLLNI